MNGIKRNIDGTEYPFYGPNKTLVSWMERSELAQTVCEKSGLELKTMYRALSKISAEDQLIAAKEAIRRLWHAYPEFGPYPFLDTLSDFEFMGKFYPDYREHVNHQLRVFWLGLYLYDRNRLIRERVLAEIGQEENKVIQEFVRRWHACAVYHDIGYILENQSANEPEGDAWKAVCQTLNDSLQAPLSQLPEFERKLTRAVEMHVIQTKQIFRPNIRIPKAMEYDGGEDLLDLITEFGVNTRLGSSKEKGQSPFRLYYDYALSHDSGNRPRFRDHGIASAVMMLKIWMDFKDYVSGLCAYSDDPLLTPLSEELNALSSGLSTGEATMIAAAGAVALHNIMPFLWDLNDTLVHGLTLHNFKIRMSQEGLQPPLEPTPMAFLLGVADTLQTWDRPRFRAMRKHDIPGLSDQDMHLCVDHNRIYLFLKQDQRFTSPESDPDSLYMKTIGNMKDYLDNQAIEDLLMCRKCKDRHERPMEKEDHATERESREPDRQTRNRVSDLKSLSDRLDASCLETYYKGKGTPTLDMLLAGLPEGKIHSDLQGEDFVISALKELKTNGSIPALFILIGIKTSDEAILQQIKMITSEISDPEKLFPRTWTQFRPDDREKIEKLWPDPSRLTLKRVLSEGYYEELVKCFSREVDADILLDSISFSAMHKPRFKEDPKTFWHGVCREISRGSGVTFEALFRAAGERYPANPVFANFK